MIPSPTEVEPHYGSFGLPYGCEARVVQTSRQGGTSRHIISTVSIFEHKGIIAPQFHSIDFSLLTRRELTFVDTALDDKSRQTCTSRRVGQCSRFDIFLTHQLSLKKKATSTKVPGSPGALPQLQLTLFAKNDPVI